MLTLFIHKAAKIKDVPACLKPNKKEVFASISSVEVIAIKWFADLTLLINKIDELCNNFDPNAIC